MQGTKYTKKRSLKFTTTLRPNAYREALHMALVQLLVGAIRLSEAPARGNPRPIIEANTD